MHIQKKKEEVDEVEKILGLVCDEIDKLEFTGTHHPYYTRPILEVACQNAHNVADEILFRSLEAILSTNQSGYDIIQIAVIHRSERNYSLIYDIGEHKNLYITIVDSSTNNILHLAGRLAPSRKLNHTTGVALQLQGEIQWRQETPDMVFTREHENLLKEGVQWIKTTAESSSITAVLITTIVFAAAITVPGGRNQDTGIPVYTKDIAFIIFSVSDAISLFASSTALLVFLSILTACFYEKDFLVSLPRRLLIEIMPPRLRKHASGHSKRLKKRKFDELKKKEFGSMHRYVKIKLDVASENLNVDTNNSDSDSSTDESADDINVENMEADNINYNDDVDDVDEVDDVDDVNVRVNDHEHDKVEERDASVNIDIFDPKNWDSLTSDMIKVLVAEGLKRDKSIEKGPKDKNLRRFSSTFYTRILPNNERKGIAKGHLGNEGFGDWQHLENLNSLGLILSKVQFKHNSTKGVDWRERPDPGCLLTPVIVHPTRNSSANSPGPEEHHLEKKLLKVEIVKVILAVNNVTRLNGLTLIAIENDILESVNYDDLINNFASKNARRTALFK
ncbi:ankyrin repeat-containing domain, PGG domain protein [Tanacetum coccineum]|uniref:Ankyrin repeat-containing domain, PGG domain protein n=1 Tax=Tanacetum coccineum TaxID=301880 RepID=A0ABQ4ZT29_9ASTR